MCMSPNTKDETWSGSFNFNIFQLFSKVFISFWSEGSIIQIKLGGNVWYDDCKYI